MCSSTTHDATAARLIFRVSFYFSSQRYCLGAESIRCVCKFWIEGGSTDILITINNDKLMTFVIWQSQGPNRAREKLYTLPYFLRITRDFLFLGTSGWTPLQTEEIQSGSRDLLSGGDHIPCDEKTIDLGMRVRVKVEVFYIIVSSPKWNTFPPSKSR